MAQDWRNDRIDELERENAALRAQICEQQAMLEARQKVIALLERRTSHARPLWTTIALATLAASLALPLAVATTTSAVAALIVMHLTVGAAVIPAMAHTARAR